MGIEFELKYAATPEQQSAIAAEMGSDYRLYHMETTYYDTPSLELAARRWTLRCRLENGKPVCTLKTPAGELGRGEWACDCGDIGDAIPELCKLSGHAELAALASHGLVPICGAKFVRQAYTLPSEGALVEVAVDAGKLFGGGRETPLCEVEIELLRGSREDAIRCAVFLAQRFGLTPEPKSKFRRALELAKGE